MQSLKEIIFLKKNILNEKIDLLYRLLILNRKHIIEKVLLDPSKNYFFVTISSFRDKFIEIEKYIFNYIFLIKFLHKQGDTISLIKANQALNYLAKEMLDYKKNGLLVYTLNIILNNCLKAIKSTKVFKNFNFCHEILKKYLLLISCLIKISNQLKIPKLYYKFIDHYGKIFDLALEMVSTSHIIEIKILNSNLLFNIGSFFVQKNLLNSSIKLYKEVINIQNNLEFYSFVFGA